MEHMSTEKVLASAPQLRWILRGVFQTAISERCCLYVCICVRVQCFKVTHRWIPSFHAMLLFFDEWMTRAWHLIGGSYSVLLLWRLIVWSNLCVHWLPTQTLHACWTYIHSQTQALCTHGAFLTFLPVRSKCSECFNASTLFASIHA